MKEEVKAKVSLRDSGILISKKVKIVSLKRGNDFLPKDGEDIYSGAVLSMELPTERKTNQRVQVLTPEEQIMFEDELNLKRGDLSFYDKDKGYWSSPKGVLKLMKEDNVLDLSNPVDYLKWLIAKANKRIIAPSWQERHQSGEYRFALVDADEETKVVNNKLQLMKEVYKLVGKIEESSTKMQDVLRLYGKRTLNNDVEFLKAEIQNLIDKDPQRFIDIVNDKRFNIKIQIEKALDIKALERTSTKGYALKGGDLIGRTLEETISWFENPLNADLVLMIKAQLQNTVTQ